MSAAPVAGERPSGLRAAAAGALRPLCLRWPWRWGRRSLVRRLTPTAAQIPVGQPARMRPGFRVRLGPDPLYRRIWLFGEFEPAETRFLQRFLRPGEGVIDVGANFGWHTLVAARAVGAGGRVLAIEPVPPTLEALRDNLALNDCAARVTVAATAVGEAAGETTVYSYGDGSLAEASQDHRDRPDAVPHVCPIQTLDAVVAAHPVPAPVLLKVDVEGFELEVLRGATGLLAPPDAPAVLFEVSRGFLARRAIRAGDLHELLTGLGYDAYWRFGRYRRLDPVETLEWTGAADLHNFVAAKPHLAPRVRAAR